MRDIKWFIVHCAYTPITMDVDAARVDKWHKKNGWSGIGYNYFIKLDGTVEKGRSLTEFGAHTIGRGANKYSIGVCFAGGMENNKPKDTIKVDQMFSILRLFREAQELFPNIKIAGHNQFDKKPCPCFDMREYAQKHGLKKSEILMDELIYKL